MIVSGSIPNSITDVWLVLGIGSFLFLMLYWLSLGLVAAKTNTQQAITTCLAIICLVPYTTVLCEILLDITRLDQLTASRTHPFTDLVKYTGQEIMKVIVVGGPVLFGLTVSIILAQSIYLDQRFRWLKIALLLAFYFVGFFMLHKEIEKLVGKMNQTLLKDHLVE